MNTKEYLQSIHNILKAECYDTRQFPDDLPYMMFLLRRAKDTAHICEIRETPQRGKYIWAKAEVHDKRTGRNSFTKIAAHFSLKDYPMTAITGWQIDNSELSFSENVEYAFHLSLDPRKPTTRRMTQSTLYTIDTAQKPIRYSSEIVCGARTLADEYVLYGDSETGTERTDRDWYVTLAREIPVDEKRIWVGVEGQYDPEGRIRTIKKEYAVQEEYQWQQPDSNEITVNTVLRGFDFLPVSFGRVSGIPLEYAILPTRVTPEMVIDLATERTQFDIFTARQEYFDGNSAYAPIVDM